MYDIKSIDELKELESKNKNLYACTSSDKYIIDINSD